LVGELPDSQRTVLSLARLDGLKLREIASRLDVPLGTVKSRLHAATQWLTERWEENE
jgi:RNA polymerase sigma-70 factor (ECF subfamily)